MNFSVIIPARYASTRFPGKPLVDINGKPMVQHVYERAIESGASKVIVATDDARIAKVVSDFGGQYCMTGSHHESGTERLAEVIDMEGIGNYYLRHIGIYAYRAGFIKQYVSMSPSGIEQIESLEQLRVLWHGEKIHVDIARETPPAGIDTPEDLERILASQRG